MPTLSGKFEQAYVTACCVIVDRAQERLSYSTAGHPAPLLRRRDGDIEPLDERGMALVLFPEASFITTEVSFYAGDRLLLFTDGLLEARRIDSEEFLETRRSAGSSQRHHVVGSCPGACWLHTAPGSAAPHRFPTI
ncbi:MAG: serine/threonine-protein phosphatase [Acidobacteria bacterium]|nr:serine/threonine-protein phosphatase [Acidobacteriota bacterium]